MRISSVLCIWKFPKGNVWLGKHRLVPPQGQGAKASEFKRLIREYENMKILAKPYLTEAEESCQPDWSTAQKQLARHEAMRLNMKDMRHQTMEDHFFYLTRGKRFV
ncbi:hypothetical protein RvY_15573 [Ramazzottius varieornatus]|uniref:Uncharacterized protein n=1 Tax=Ramazzottius varieornatus TaxID=947166 RepID=A0A1D1W013_RAMVA|nr:hypothetical protein RvY_15573 [Ramazzottius varieornatus]